MSPGRLSDCTSLRLSPASRKCASGMDAARRMRSGATVPLIVDFTDRSPTACPSV